MESPRLIDDPVIREKVFVEEKDASQDQPLGDGGDWEDGGPFGVFDGANVAGSYVVPRWFGYHHGMYTILAEV